MDGCYWSGSSLIWFVYGLLVWVIGWAGCIYLGVSGTGASNGIEGMTGPGCFLLGRVMNVTQYVLIQCRSLGIVN